MWFGNFQHTFQLASFHVQLKLGKEEAWQMRVKVQYFRSLCPEGLWWDFSSKIVPLNPPESGFGTSCCRPRGNGKQDCCKSRFHMKYSITVTSALGDRCLLSCWCETFHKQTAPSNDITHLYISSLRLVISFFPSTSICENVEKPFCIYLSMNSTHRQNQALLSLPLWCILIATGKQPFPSILSWEWSDFLMHHGELHILKLVQWFVRKVPTQFSLTEIQKFSFIPLQLEISTA